MRGFRMNFQEDAPISMDIQEEENIESNFQDAQETVRESYNFGDGLLYDFNTATVSADMTNVVEDTDKLVTSRAVKNALADVGVSYSADEHICGRWIDGKVLYEKLCTFNDVKMANTRTEGVTHGIENVDEIFVAEAYLRDTGIDKAQGKFINVIGGVNLTAREFPVNWVADDTYIWMNASYFMSASENRTWRIVLRYTKNEG